MAAVPVALLALVARRSPERTSGAFWFLPVALALSTLSTLAMSSGPWLVEEARVVTMPWWPWLLVIMPPIVLAVGLWIVRPRYSDQSPTSLERSGVQRTRQALLIVAAIERVTLPLIGLSYAIFGSSPAMFVSGWRIASATGTLLSALPVAVFAFAALRSSERLSGAFWFLPLTYGLTALSTLAVNASYLALGVREEIARNPWATILFLPSLILAIGLWVVRPRVSDPEREVVR